MHAYIDVRTSISNRVKEARVCKESRRTYQDQPIRYHLYSLPRQFGDYHGDENLADYHLWMGWSCSYSF